VKSSRAARRYLGSLDFCFVSSSFSYVRVYLSNKLIKYNKYTAQSELVNVFDSVVVSSSSCVRGRAR
jgi:hypothetical protein